MKTRQLWMAPETAPEGQEVLAAICHDEIPPAGVIIVTREGKEWRDIEGYTYLQDKVWGWQPLPKPPVAKIGKMR